MPLIGKDKTITTCCTWIEFFSRQEFHLLAPNKLFDSAEEGMVDGLSRNFVAAYGVGQL